MDADHKQIKIQASSDRRPPANAGENRRSFDDSIGSESICFRRQRIGLTAVLVLLGVLVLYLIKSAYGIDLVKGFSLGIWSRFQEWFGW